MVTDVRRRRRPDPVSRRTSPLSIRARALLGSSIAVLAAACQAGASGDASTAERIEVSVSEDGCSPSTIETASGPVTFVVTNAGSDTGEFEIILGGERVIDEVENIIPGFVVNMSTRLDGGTYAMQCGNLQTTPGVLTVTGGAAATPAPNTVVDETKLNAARDAYADYVDTQVTHLLGTIDVFASAVEAGDVEAAKASYAAARVPWERIEPIAELFPDLDGAIDFREEDFAGGVDDPEFKGFHRIEKVLWADGTADGLAPLATELRENVAELKTRIDALEIDPRVMARGAGELIDEVAQSKMTGEEDRYSKMDLYAIDANVDGSAIIVEQLRPILTELDPEYLASLDAASAGVTEVIETYADGDGFEGFDTISAEDLKLMQARLADLSELLAQLPGTLGLAA
jgi:iron uptake system component EfeO